MKPLFFSFLPVNHSQLQQALAGKTVLITGASYGVGECLAEVLATTPAHLILVARTEAKLLEVKQRIEASGGQADIFPCDLKNTDEVQALLHFVYQLSGGVDIFVSNANKSICRSIFKSLDRPHDFTCTMNLNYFAPVQLMLGLIPSLVVRQGQVINISTVNVLLMPTPKWAAYQASKSAFDQWLRCVSPELQARGVSTTSIYLPLVRSRTIGLTPAFRNRLAMHPKQVVQLICRVMLSRRRTYAPWWLMVGQVASVLCRWEWEVGISRSLRRSLRRPKK